MPINSYSSYLEERKSEREDYIGMVLASAYSPSLQMRLNCCLSIPMHRPQEAAAVQPSGALPIAPYLGRQDGAGRSISVGCAQCPATNLGSQPDFLPLPPGFVLPWRCKPTGNPADRISGDVFHAEQRRELTHNSDELQWALAARPAWRAGFWSLVGTQLQSVPTLWTYFSCCWGSSCPR